MKRTPLYDSHITAQAKLVDFADWEMPIHYSGVVDEYQAVRHTAGLFDVSHMGRISVSGAGALPFLQRMTTNDLAQLAPLQAQYSMVCNDCGGIKDDVFIYRVLPQEYLLCVNASNKEKILAWLQECQPGNTLLEIRDRSTDMAQLALQGPRSPEILKQLGLSGIETLRPRHCLEASLLGSPSLVTRTGYTGELGYELYIFADSAARIWNELLWKGKAMGLKPAGLGARDLLRLEMGFLLYGNDIAEDITPLEAGVPWTVCFEKGDFRGREALIRQKEVGLANRLIAFELIEQGVPRHGFKVVKSQAPHDAIGEVTSGNFSPLLRKGIGMAYVQPEYAKVGTALAIDIRGKTVKAVIVKLPFYRKKSV